MHTHARACMSDIRFWKDFHVNFNLNTSPTIQDALGKEESQYPHAPVRSISSIRFGLPALLLVLCFLFLFLNQSSTSLKDRADGKYGPVGATASSLATLLAGKRMQEGGFERSSCCLSPGSEEENVSRTCTTVRLLAALLQASVLPCPFVGAASCVNMREMHSERRSPGNLCRHLCGSC